MDIEEILRACIGRKVAVTFYSHAEPTLRETSGILEKVTTEVITLKLYNSFGEIELYHLNRHSCTLLSVIDEGKR